MSQSSAAPPPQQPRMQRPSRNRVRFVGILGIIFVGWIIGITPAFKTCIHTDKNDTAYQELGENPDIISGTILRTELHAVCVEDWTEKYEGAIGAVATVFIAVFTLTLWGATEKLYGAAENDIAAFKQSMEQNRAIAAQQIEKMGEHAAEAKRAADEMAKVAIEMAKSAEAAVRAATSTGDGARAAWRSAEETGRTAVAMQNAADAMGKQATLAHQSYLATHRPRLRVRRVQTDGGPSESIGPTWITVANVGPNEAKGIRFDAVFARGFGTIRQPPWTENLNPVVGRGPDKLVPGERGTYQVPSIAYQKPASAMIPPKTLLIAEIIYGDHNGVDRRTGIGWPYRANPGEFERISEEDEYNYED